MKTVLAIAVVLASFAARAENTELSLSETANKSVTAMPTVTRSQASDTGWRFLLGQSTTRYDNSTSGLTVGGGYDLSEWLGARATYTGYRTTNYEGVRESYENISVFGQFTPVLYKIEQVTLTASLDFGASVLNNQGFFYGVALGANLDRNVGIEVSRHSGPLFSDIDSVALIGYF